MISIRDIRKSFGEKQVLHGVSFDVRDKETMVVLGKSGCGKSVLLKMVIGMMKPDAGSIEVDGKDIAALSYPDLRRLRFRFGFLFQGAALFDSMTVAENISLPMYRHAEYRESDIRERVRFALSLVGLEHAEHLMPSSLSGGMKKRAGLARALASAPRYMLYDEPTTGLDLETADGINRLINDLRTKLGVTSILVTHDLRSAFLVGDRFAILDQGRTLMTGTREEIQKSKNEDVQKYISSSLSTSGGTLP